MKEDTGSINIGLFATAMGYGHQMKLLAVQDALQEISKGICRSFKVNINVIRLETHTSKASVFARNLVEASYNAGSRIPVLRSIWDKAAANNDYKVLKYFFSGLSFVNRVTFGPIILGRDGKPLDFIISVYPAEQVLRLPKTTEVLRILPDIFGHSFYFISDRRISLWYGCPDADLEKRIKEGKEIYLHPNLAPDGKRVITLGALCSPGTIRNINSIERSSKQRGKKLKVMLQISGAGALQEMFIEILDRLDLKRIDALFVAGHHLSYLKRLLRKGLKKGYITIDESESLLKNKEFMAESKMYDESKGTFTFRSGLKILYHPDFVTAVKLIEQMKKDYEVNVVKPGDVTSTGIAHLLLPPIGPQEYINGDWACEKGFAEWAISPAEYQKRKLDKDLDEYVSKKVCRSLNCMAEDSKIVSRMLAAVGKMDNRGAYNAASFAILRSINNRSSGSSRELVHLLYAYLIKEGYCTFDRDILKKVEST